MTAKTLKRWRLVHTWSSVLCTAFMFVLCATGLPLVFKDELDSWLAPPPHAPVLSGDRPALRLDRLIELAGEREPERVVQFVFWERDDANLVGFGTGATRDAGLDDMSRELIDARTGEKVSAEPAEGGFSEMLADIHRSLCMGLLGDLVLSVMAIAFLVSLGSGVVVYLPMLRSIGFGVLRTGRSMRILALDAHNLVSMIVLVWAFVVGVTGFINTLEAPAFAKWNADTLPALLAPYRDKPPIAQRCSVDAALQTARAAVPAMIPTSIGFPESPFGSPRHFLIWMRGDGLFTSRLFTPVLVEAGSCALASAAGFPWYLTALELSRPLHFGDYGGLPLKLVWALLDVLLLIVLATGLYLWMRKKA